MKKEDFVYIPKIDSCKLFIPIEKVSIHHDYMNDVMITKTYSKTTGLEYDTLEKEVKNIAFKKENIEDGTYIEIGVRQYGGIGNSSGADTFLWILINSKHLHRDYFKGITKDTLKSLYEYFMSLNVFHCDYKDFFNALYTDTDICFDFTSTKSQFDVLRKNIRKSVKNSDKWYLSNKKENTGIWAPNKTNPRTTATPTTPYVKFYDKELDFSIRSFKFANAYMKGIDYRDLFRFEGTIRNRTHARRLGLNDVKTIGELLECDLQTILSQMFNEYFLKPKLVKVGNTSPTDLLIMDLMNYCISKKISRGELFSYFERYDVSKQSRATLIKKYHKIMMKEEIDKETLEANETTKKIFDYLGVKTNLNIETEDGKQITD